MERVSKARIWGWMSFDWAQQPIYTLGLTFIFGPYFASVAARYFMGQGLEETAADAQAQSLWSLGQTIGGLLIAFSAPILGAWADLSGRKLPWIVGFSVVYVLCSWSIWWLMPDGTGLWLVLILFNIGIIAAESGLNFVNAILPSLGSRSEIGRISGSASALGYWGGVVALFIVLLFFEDGAGHTLIGLQPPFGLDPATNEGTRAVGPFIAIWYLVFMVPFFLWVRDPKGTPAEKAGLGDAMRDLRANLGRVLQRRSLSYFLLGSMLYRDALNALYAFGGVYAALVLEWKTMQVGIFGIVAAIAAAIVTWAGGLADRRYGPKPVIRVAVIVLSLVSLILVSMSRSHFGPFTLAEGSLVPDIVLYICGAAIGGAGGALYSASRSMMVRHTDPDRPAEAFGLFALSGKATAFIAPMAISIATYMTQSNQLGFLPVVILFLIGLACMARVHPEGDQQATAAANAGN